MADDRDEIDELFLATKKYIEARGGTLTVANGPMLRTFTPGSKYDYQVVINCSGKLPPKPENKILPATDIRIRYAP